MLCFEEVESKDNNEHKKPMSTQTPQSNDPCKMPTDQISLILPPSLSLSIVDLYLRRPCEDLPAFGILMGFKSDFGGEIHARSCYPLAANPMQNNNQAESCAKIPIDLHRIAFPKDQLIGWFTSDSKLMQNSTDFAAWIQPLKETILRECSGNAIELELHLQPLDAVHLEARIFHSFASSAAAATSSTIIPIVECSLGEWNICRELYEGPKTFVNATLLSEAAELHKQASMVISKLSTSSFSSSE